MPGMSSSPFFDAGDCRGPEPGPSPFYGGQAAGRQKNPPQHLAGRDLPNALAAFVKRPQAVAQIGAVRDPRGVSARLSSRISECRHMTSPLASKGVDRASIALMALSFGLGEVRDALERFTAKHQCRRSAR